MMLPWTKKIFRVVSQPGYRPSRTKRSSTDAGTSRRMTMKRHCQPEHSRSWRRQPKRFSYR